MGRLLRRTAPLPVARERLWDWHTRPAAFERLAPPWERIEMTRWAPIEDGARQEIRIRQFGRWWTMRPEIRDVVPGHAFTDVQAGGPFRAWRHVHRILDDDLGVSVEDDLTWDLPLGPIGELVAGAPIRRTIERTFRFRHRRTANDMAFLARYRLPGSVAVTGASGLIGSALCSFLEAGGSRVLRLTRRVDAGPGWVHWDPAANELDAAALDGVDAVVHLAGEPIGQRWSPTVKARIRDSRVTSTRLLSETLARLASPPAVLVSGSAIGVYGARGDEPLTEDSPPGDGFLAEVGTAWEAATAAAEDAGIRVVHLRTGVVLSPAGGALAAQLPLFRLGLGGPLGDGAAWQSWIAIDDIVGLIIHALATDIAGPLNGTAPEPVPQRVFARTLGRVLRRPAILPAPAAAIRLILGEMGQRVVLEGQRVLPARAIETGFTFRHSDLEDALRFVLGR